MRGLIFKQMFFIVLFPFDLGVWWFSLWSIVVRELKTCNIAQLCKIPRVFGKFVSKTLEMPVEPHLEENLSFLLCFGQQSSKTIFW